MSIAEQIERLKKATAWAESPNYSYDSNRGQKTENERLSKILRAYEQVIKIQAEALEKYGNKENWFGVYEEQGFLWRNEFISDEGDYQNLEGTIQYAGREAREAIASVEKILVEVK